MSWGWPHCWKPAANNMKLKAVTCIELGPTKRLRTRWKMHATCIGLDNDTAEAVTIVGSREVKHVELEVGLNSEGLSMIGWLRHLSRPDANLAQIDN